MAKLVVLFATPQDEDSPSIEVEFPGATVEEIHDVSTTLRVGGTVNPWVTYVVPGDNST